jgi:hypothetical protein
MRKKPPSDDPEGDAEASGGNKKEKKNVTSGKQ